MIQFLLLLFVFLLSFLPANGAVHTVCMSGCSFSSLQPAIEAAQPGDIVELEAGETFQGPISLPVKQGSDFITIRSSRWKELPLHERITPNHLVLLARLEATNGGVIPGTLLYAGNYQKQISTIDVAANRVSFHYSFGQITAHEPIICTSTGRLPTPLEPLKTYYPHNFTGPDGAPQLGFSASPTGPVIDLVDQGNGLHRCMAYRQGAHHYRFQGLSFETQNGLVTDNLILIGSGEEFSDFLLPHHIEFQHVIVRGKPSQNGPRNCLVLNGNDILLEDSYVDSCKYFEVESHAISIYNSSGPLIIRNNYLSAASIGVLTGGAPNGLDTDVSGLVLERNHIEKPGSYLYQEGSGQPTRACTPGNFYRQTSITPNTCANGACWVCQENGEWLADMAAIYKSQNFNTKGGMEFKGCRNCRIEGNIIDKTYAAQDSGNTACMVFVQSVQNGPQSLLENVEVRNNWCKDTWSGILVFGDAFENFRKRSKNVHFSNILLSGQAPFPRGSIHPSISDAQSFTIKASPNIHGVTFDHLTSRSQYAAAGVLLIGGKAGEKALGFQLANSLIFAGAYTFFMDGAAQNCGSAGLPYYMDTSGGLKPVRNSVFYEASQSGLGSLTECMTNVTLENTVGFVSAENHRLEPSSPFSAACGQGCKFTSTDGKDVGVDMDELEDATNGVMEGTLPLRERMKVAIEVSSRHAVLRFEKLPSQEPCQVHLFTDFARRMEHPDTIGGAGAERAGNLMSGPGIQFLLGKLNALEPNENYYGYIQCGTSRTVFRFLTRPPGNGERSLRKQLNDATAHDVVLEWSASPDFEASQTGDPALFAGQMATAEVAFQGLMEPVYLRWRKRDAQGVTLENGIGPTEIVLP